MVTAGLANDFQIRFVENKLIQSAFYVDLEWDGEKCSFHPVLFCDISVDTKAETDHSIC